MHNLIQLGRGLRRQSAWASVLLCLCTLFQGAAAQVGNRRPKVSMQLSSGVVRVGEKVHLIVVADGQESARVKALPSVEGLRFGSLEGPSQNQVVTIINGRRQRVVDLRWSLQVSCETEGQFEIPGVTLEINGEELSAAPVTLKVLRDMSGESLGFFELSASSSKVVEGMPFSLELNFGWDPEAKANYANLSIPWWDDLYGAIEMEESAAPKGTEGVTVNDKYSVPIERVKNPAQAGRVAFRLRRTFIATRSGPLELPTSFLEFGERSQSILSQRVKNNYFVRANGLDLEVVPLPREGQPFEFSGAVGSFKVQANVDNRDLLVGDSIKLTVDWTGQGNMEFFEAPVLERLDEFNGFQFYGSTEEKSLGRRRVTYDLAPLTDAVREVPAVPLWSFDPELYEYVKLESTPIPLRVRALAKARSLDPGEAEVPFEADIHDIWSGPLAAAPAGQEQSGRQDADRLLLGAAAGILPLWLLLRSLVRRQGDPSSKRQKGRRLALRNLQRELRAQADAKAGLQAFARYLGARSGEDAAAWIGRDLSRYALSAGLDEHLADWNQASELMERLERAVYADGPAVDQGDVLAMAERLTGAGL